MAPRTDTSPDIQGMMQKKIFKIVQLAFCALLAGPLDISAQTEQQVNGIGAYSQQQRSNRKSLKKINRPLKDSAVIGQRSRATRKQRKTKQQVTPTLGRDEASSTTEVIGPENSPKMTCNQSLDLSEAIADLVSSMGTLSTRSAGGETAANDATISYTYEIGGRVIKTGVSTSLFDSIQDEEEDQSVSVAAAYNGTEEEPKGFPKFPSVDRPNTLQKFPKTPKKRKQPSNTCCMFSIAASNGPGPESPRHQMIRDRFDWTPAGCNQIIHCYIYFGGSGFTLDNCFDAQSGRNLGTGSQATSELQCTNVQSVAIHHSNENWGFKDNGMMIDALPVRPGETTYVCSVLLGCSSLGDQATWCAHARELSKLLESGCAEKGRVHMQIIGSNQLCRNRPGGSWNCPSGVNSNNPNLRSVEVTPDGFMVCKLGNDGWVPDLGFCGTGIERDMTANPDWKCRGNAS